MPVLATEVTGGQDEATTGLDNKVRCVYKAVVGVLRSLSHAVASQEYRHTTTNTGQASAYMHFDCCHLVLVTYSAPTIV